MAGNFRRHDPALPGVAGPSKASMKHRGTWRLHRIDGTLIKEGKD
jgi:hypothetical protein